MIHYPISVFNKCVLSGGVRGVLDPSIVDSLARLEEMFTPAGGAAPTGSGGGYSDARSGGGGGGGGGAPPMRVRQRVAAPPAREEEKWNARPAFKATAISLGDGVEKQLNDIRTSLNKISAKMYDEIAASIVAAIETVAADAATMARVAQFVFDVSSANKFFAKIYADLYKLLMARFEIFGAFLAEFVRSYGAGAAELRYVNPEVDYDQYCLYTKSCDKRKAMAAFISHMAVNGSVATDAICDIMEMLASRTRDHVSEADRIAEVEEMADVLAIFVTIGSPAARESAAWTARISPAISAIATMKSRDWPGLSSRALFKYQDIATSITALPAQTGRK